MRKVLWAVLAVLVLLVVVLGFALYRLIGGGPEGRAERACRDYVARQLTAPDTAEFSDLSVQDGSGSVDYVVSGYMRAENEQGIYLRGMFACNVTERLGDLIVTGAYSD